jgi:DNA polymerase elongation subunit (family B)
MGKNKVNSAIIENFLNGTNKKENVVGIEANYTDTFVYLIINDGISKYTEKHNYKPFLWFTEEVSQKLYGGKKLKSIEAAKRFGVTSKRLKVSDEDGNAPDRLQNGYKYLATCDKSYNDLLRFFKEGGVEVFGEHSKLFFTFTPVEQFMIQTGIRMFKGKQDYNDIHRFQFDLETEGLSGTKDAIFQIGMRDNKGFEYVLETKGKTLQEKRDSERDIIEKFFKTIDGLKPDVITGYNSESFDWTFIVDRCERLSIDLPEIAITLENKGVFKRKPSILKLGNEMESYDQTYMFGYNIIDIAHSVRRAQAINSDIKSWGLKYITKYSDINKPNRVYVPGDKIHTIWADSVNNYAFNENNGDWYKISDNMPLVESYSLVKGDYIVQRYLLDDLWETEQIDTIFNQASFLIAKLLPTTYARSSTMGTASQWKLIMAAWSYQNGLAIPLTDKKRDFTGGLSRLLQLGYARNVVKLDYAALYPKCQLTHEIFPDLDISGVMAGMLEYIVDTRDTYKFLTTKEKKNAKKLEKEN